MEFEDLQAIWNTQSNTPVFSPKDTRLAVALYQQREHARRRFFRIGFAPIFLIGLVMLGISGLLFAVFYAKSLSIRIHPRDFPMSFWDGVALMIAGSLVLAVAAPMYVERKKHERTQNVFAPSLREELDRGIAQLDFEVRLLRTSRLMKTIASFAIAIELILWEIGRLNGDPAPWGSVGWTSVFMIGTSWIGFAAARKEANEVWLARKNALESIRAGLDEEGGVEA